MLLLAAFRYTPDQVRKMEESNRIRKQLEPLQLIEVVRPFPHGCLITWIFSSFYLIFKAIAWWDISVFLVKIKGLKEDFFIDEKVVHVPHQIKQMIADEILATLKGVNARDNAPVQQGDYNFESKLIKFLGYLWFQSCILESFLWSSLLFIR